MKGYSPNLNLNKGKEINSLEKQSFIELGVKNINSKCYPDCNCISEKECIHI